MELDRLLEFLEENIDLEYEEEKKRLHIDCLNYEKIPFLPLTIMYPLDENIKPFPYKEAFYDPEKMLYNELVSGMISVYNSVKLKDYCPLHIRSNHGIGLMASLFGAKCKIVFDNMPWVEHFNSLDRIRDIVSKGIPELISPLLKREIENYKYFNDRLKEFPKCYEAIKITQPDLQGPFDIAHMLIGSDIFLYLYDYPDVMHKLLDLITNTYIKTRKYLDALSILRDKAGDSMIYVHGAIYIGEVLIKDDTALINLSKEMYQIYAKQYNLRIIEAFKNKASLHYCGPGRDWHIKNIKDQKFIGINYGNPEMYKIDVLHNEFKRDKLGIIGWKISNYYKEIQNFAEFDISTGVSLIIETKSLEDAHNIMYNHTN